MLFRSDLSNQKNMGNSVVTTLDTKLQKVAYDSLGVYRGAIVVMEPKTGRILALVSKPDFNPNNIDSIWENLITDANSSVLLNRVTQGLYPPGSTFKIITALEFIRENPTTFQNYTYQCNSQYREGKDVINCYHGTSHGSEDLFKSFAKSCNASFANIGSQLDKNSFEKTLEDLLFHCELPLKVEYSKSSINMSDETTTSDLLQSAIGQGKTQITPMHLALITSSIANRGTLMKPYFVEKVISSNGGVVKQYGKNNKYGELMTTEEAQILTELLTEVVQTGTGTKLKSLSYQAAGKTGSAEYNNNKNDSHAWFTGFAPADDPQIVVTIIIEGAGSGGDYAVPIAKRTFEAYLGE